MDRKTRWHLFSKGMALFLLLIGFPAAAAGATIKGKVVGYQDARAKIQYEGTLSPNIGDPAEIGFELGGELIPMEGRWKIVEVDPRFAWAACDGGGGEAPQIDYIVRIQSSNPKKRKSLARTEHVASSANAGNRSLSLLQACEQGDSEACYKVGLHYVRGKGVTQSFARSEDYFRRGCDGDHAQACTSLAWLYDFGRGVARNYPKAAQLYQKGCDGGDAEGCFYLGLMYESGKGVARNLETAVQLYQKGCDGGNASGCTNLGVMYESGKGVAKNPQTAAQFYKKGCDGGNAQGCTNLGVLYEYSNGVTRTLAIAAHDYQKGCDGGSAQGCALLGWLIYQGYNDIPADRSRGRQLLEKGCQMGDSWACDKLKTLDP